MLASSLELLRFSAYTRNPRHPFYYAGEIDVTNADAYAKDYAPKARAIIEKHGGRFVAIGGAAATTTGGKVTAFEVDTPKRVVIQVWDSIEKIKAWRADPECVALRKIGDQYAKFRAFAVDGLSQ